MSYLREKHLRGDDTAAAPVPDRDLDDRSRLIEALVDEWQIPDVADKHLALASDQYHALRSGLGKDSINQLTADTFFSLIQNVNAVHARVRYFPGGEPTFRKAFLKKDNESIRKAVRHLLDLSLDRFRRMGDCIFNTNFKLQELNRSGIQERYAWLSDDGTPICNSRTERVLRWLGYAVEVHS